MKRIISSTFFFLILLLLLICNESFPQPQKESLAFKSNRPQSGGRIYVGPPVEYSYALEEKFTLIQKANAGDPSAEHEIGIRTLLGYGFEVDTAKALVWIKRSAEKNFPTAKYNYGIFQMNAWGTEWSPFEAYKNILFAAKNGMAQAQYIIGMLNTDNLVVAKNLGRANAWLTKSIAGGYEPSKLALERVKAMGGNKPAETSENPLDNKPADTYTQNNTTQQKSNGSLLVYINFDADTIATPTDSLILSDFYRESGLDTLYTNYVLSKISSTDTLLLNKIELMIKYGSPEALTLKGIMTMSGIIFKKDLLIASEYLVMAARLESPRARRITWEMIKKNNFFTLLQNAYYQKNPTAYYVWAALTAIGFDNQISFKDAFSLWNQASNYKHIQSIVEIGKCYFTGNPIQKDFNSALKYWEQASTEGNVESKVRILMFKIFGNQFNTSEQEDIIFLKNAAANGSLLAETVLGYCYEKGIGAKKSLAEAAVKYRGSAQRGSETGYKALLRLYDSLRPDEPDFKIENKSE